MFENLRKSFEKPIDKSFHEVYIISVYNKYNSSERRTDMVSKFETVFLGMVEKQSAKGNTYQVVTFLDEGEAVSVMVSRNAEIRNFPKVLEPCFVTVSASLGRYQKVEVLDLERAE